MSPSAVLQSGMAVVTKESIFFFSHFKNPAEDINFALSISQTDILVQGDYYHMP